MRLVLVSFVDVRAPIHKLAVLISGPAIPITLLLLICCISIWVAHLALVEVRMYVIEGILLELGRLHGLACSLERTVDHACARHQVRDEATGAASVTT